MDVSGCDGLEETGPTGSGVEFTVGRKERIFTIDAAVQASATFVVQCAGKSAFGVSSPRDFVLQFNELRFPLPGSFSNLWHRDVR